jgi:phosphatidylserine/phosphatidylglycerophosphate/cardiolipin synthase-like enzyme
MILDDCVVLTGSFNFTKAAEEHNAENLLVINDLVLAGRYIENWHAHEQHSEAYAREPKPAALNSEDRNPKPERRPKSETRILR